MGHISHWLCSFQVIRTMSHFQYTERWLATWWFCHTAKKELVQHSKWLGVFSSRCLSAFCTVHNWHLYTYLHDTVVHNFVHNRQSRSKLLFVYFLWTWNMFIMYFVDYIRNPRNVIPWVIILCVPLFIFKNIH
jgi:hypothetical protein